MSKMNCWEFKKCGREVGGERAIELGVCPAAVDLTLNGVHGGKNAGRSCWAAVGTLSDGKVQGTFARTIKNCLACDFYIMVWKEENDDFKLSSEIVKMLERAV